MFKSRRGFNPYYGKRRQSVSPLWIALSIPALLLLLELLTRILVGVLGQGNEFALYQGEPANFSAYRLRFLNEAEQTYDGLPNRGSLEAQQHLAMGYKLAGNQESSYWYINDQGFRDLEPVPLAKPKDEVRIFLLGGSTAFGQWNSGNEATIASKLQARLNERIAQQKNSPEKYQPDVLSFYKPERDRAKKLERKIRGKRYRVINAAVPGYASGNELAQLALEILPYKPDVIVVLNGYSDLMLSSTQEATEIPHLESFLNNAPRHFAAYLTQPVKEWFQNTYIVKATQHWMVKPEPTVAQQSLVVTEDDIALSEQLPSSAEELELRLSRYRQNHLQMLRLSVGGGASLVLALQPEITTLESTESEAEQQVLKALGDKYIQQVQNDYPQFAQINQQLGQSFPKNVKAVNFYDALPKLLAESQANSDSEATFADAIHLSEKGNQVLATQLYYTITSLKSIQIIPKNSELR